MGMFDYIDASRFNIPNLQKRNYPQEWQTKSLENQLFLYVIEKDGTLTKDNRKVLFTGILNFYGRAKYGKWIECVAKYNAGDLVEDIYWQ